MCIRDSCMTDEEVRTYLRPRSHWKEIIGTAIAVAGAVWGSTAWLHSRASSEDTKALQNGVFKLRLGGGTMEGGLKALNVRIDEGFRAMGSKIDQLSLIHIS